MSKLILEEMSDRCKRLLSPRVLIARSLHGQPFKELTVGRVFIYERGSLLRVELYRLDYTFTTDTVYTARHGRHASSSWPNIRVALTILRNDMILDDLASS